MGEQCCILFEGTRGESISLLFHLPEAACMAQTTPTFVCCHFFSDSPPSLL